MASNAKRPPAPPPANVDYRSAETGKFVTEQYATRHPRTTVREVNKPPKK